MQLGLGALHDVFVITYFQELKAFGVIGNLLGLPLDRSASEYAVLVPDQVFGRAPHVPEKDASANARVGLDLIPLLRLEDVVDGLSEAHHEVLALVARDPLVRCTAVGSDLVLVDGVGHVRDQPAEEDAVHSDPLLEPRLDVMLDRPELFLPDLDSVLHHPVRLRRPHRRLDGNGLADALGRHGLLQREDARLLVALESNLLALVTRLVQDASDVLDDPLGHALLLDAQGPEGPRVVVVDDEGRLHLFIGFLSRHEGVVHVNRHSQSFTVTRFNEVLSNSRFACNTVLAPTTVVEVERVMFLNLCLRRKVRPPRNSGSSHLSVRLRRPMTIMNWFSISFFSSFISQFIR